MLRPPVLVCATFALATLAAAFVGEGSTARPAAAATDSGTIRIHLLGHAIGAERYAWSGAGDSLVLDDAFAYDDRGGHIELATTMRLGRDLTPVSLRSRGRSYRFVNVDAEVTVIGARAIVRNRGDSTSVALPSRFFVAAGYAPLATRASLIAYWSRHGRPRTLDVMPGAPLAPVRIEARGTDTLRIAERRVVLRRFSVDGIAWGRETVWLDDADRFASIVTRANMLPLEGVRDELAAALPTFQSIAVADAMRDLATRADTTRTIARGTFALVGARVIVPHGTRVIDARGTTIVPGLWDMHAHVALGEWGSAYLGVGVTTVRDMGGERGFLVAMRDAIDARRGLGPRMLLAGLVDGVGPLAFGTVTARTPDEGRAVVDAYHASGFRQIKLYTMLAPDVVGAIIRRAHELGMTTTGHVPRAMSLAQLVDSGLDHVAHLPIAGDVRSDSVRRIIAHLAERHVVVDPTMAWNELLGRARETPPSSFQPALAGAPWPIVAAYGSVRNDIDSVAARTRLDASLAIVRALHEAGVTIVAGTDYGVPGHSLLRELELYVRAGFTPIDAIRSATSVPARVMGLSDDVGTIEPGKRADLLVLARDPLADIANVRSARWVVAHGRMYDCAALERSVGFGPTRDAAAQD